jgi:hypothetical protein
MATFLLGQPVAQLGRLVQIAQLRFPSTNRRLARSIAITFSPTEPNWDRSPLPPNFGGDQWSLWVGPALAAVITREIPLNLLSLRDNFGARPGVLRRPRGWREVASVRGGRFVLAAVASTAVPNPRSTPLKAKYSRRHTDEATAVLNTRPTQRTAARSGEVGSAVAAGLPERLVVAVGAPAEDEQQVGEAVEVADDLGADLLAAGDGEPLGAPANRPAHV